MYCKIISKVYYITFKISLGDVASEKGTVGLATPNLTGAIKESAVSHNSSIAIFDKAWKTLLHFPNGTF